MLWFCLFCSILFYFVLFHFSSRSAGIRDPSLRASICTALLTREKCKSPRRSSWTKPKNMFWALMCWKGHSGVWDGVKALNQCVACWGEPNQSLQRGRHNNSAAEVNINVQRQDYWNESFPLYERKTQRSRGRISNIISFHHTDSLSPSLDLILFYEDPPIQTAELRTELIWCDFC